MAWCLPAQLEIEAHETVADVHERPHGPLDGKKLALQVVDTACCLMDKFLAEDDLLQLNYFFFQRFDDRQVLVHHEIHQGVEDKTRTFGEKTL
jgi:hypothetical protein